ncbi:hypothetical protein MMPV_002779 [Pyropia vietnamensis]
MVLVHGYLDVQIISGADLGKKKPSSLFDRISNLALQSGTDPYVSVALGGKNKYFQSRVVNNSSDPVWDSSVLLNVCHELDFVELRVKGAARPGLGRARKLGRVELPADELVSSGKIEGTYNLMPYGGSDDEDIEEGELGSVTVKLRLLPLDSYKDRLDVPGTYFPLRTGCQVRLYQDAHVDENELPTVPGSSYVPGCCFRDMYAAIDAARDFVYITGWSVFTEISLLRERHGGGEDPETLGMMLKRKAEEGVQVRIMVWDELMSTSGSVLGHDYEHKGLMMTHDEETREYFEGVSNVVVVKAARKNDSDGPLADFGSTAMFTHHQKTIICDAESDCGGDKRRLISFVGGLDLTNGRFDTPTHSLFRTLASTHRPPDFHQACVPVSATKGPREPWHDQAGQICAGSASWDVLRNFTERWHRQSGSEKHALLDISGREYVSAEEEEENGRRRRGAWNVQILRSINEASAEFHDARSPGLFTRRRALIDQSIHHAYVHHVRRSKRFCFFENQYWLGSSTHWLENRNESADHLLPVEIAMRVARAVKEQEPVLCSYHAYVMIPLFPEGPPASGSVQEILAFQFQTFCMMYKIIADAISEAGTDEEPIDRLSFYFSAIRETERDSEAVDDGEFENETEELLSRTRRHSVYCHSKAVIFDDAITIIGSANCNSRSMDGARDSEIAFAAYQPEHVCGGGRSGNPRSSRRDLPAAYADAQSSSRSRGLPEGTTTRSRGFVYGGAEQDDGDDDGQSRRRHGRYGGGRRHGDDDGSGSDGHGSDDSEGRRRRHGRYGGGRRYGNDGSGSDHDGHGSGGDDEGGRRRRHGRRHGSGSNSDDDRRRRHGRYGQCDNEEQHSHSGGYGQQHGYSGGYGQQQSHSGGYAQQQSYSGGYGQHSQTPGYGEAEHGTSGYQPSTPYGDSVGPAQSGGGYGQPPDESSGYGHHQQSGYGHHQQSGYGHHQQSGYGHHQQSGYGHHQQSGYGQHQQSSYGSGGGGDGGYQQASHGGRYEQEQESYGGGGYQQHQQSSYGGGSGHHQSSHGGGYGQHQQSSYGGGGGHHQSSHGGGYGQHQQSSYGGGGSGGYQAHQQHGSHGGGGGGGACGLPRGDVASFRLNLFGEHLNCYDPVFDDPSSLECVRKVREIAEANWQAYSGDEVVEMHGWCPYPIEVSRSGRVSTRVECFPDTDAKVAGADGALPDILTT